MNADNIRPFVNRELYNKGILSSGPNCMMPDNAAHTLAADIATKLSENSSTNSFNNFINYYDRLKSTKHYNFEQIHNLYKDAGFDINSLEMEMNNAIDELLKTQTSSCYTKRPDVVDRVKNFYSDLLQDAIEKTGVSAPEPASEPASESAPEPASEPASESAPEPASEPASEPAPEGGKKKKGGKKSAKKQTKNLCLKKSTQKKSTKKSTKGKSKCESIKGCKVASGSKRTYCRKAHNKTHKKK